MNNEIYHINRQHFYIDFNWNFEFLRLNNNLQNETEIKTFSVKADYQMLKHNKNNMHILHSAEQIKIYIKTLEFELFFFDWNKHQQKYKKNWKIFHENHRKAVSMINELNIQFKKITLYMIHQEDHHTVYFLHKNIDKDQFETVCRVSE